MKQPINNAEASWRQWHRLREEGLAAEFGWLTLTSYQWLPSAPGPLDLVPGEFSVADGTAVYTPAPGGPVDDYDSGAPVVEPLSATLAEDESRYWLRVPAATRGGADETVVELGVRGGRYMIRTRARSTPARDAFDGVPTFDFDPAWALAARFEPYAAPRTETIGSFRADTTLTAEIAGDVVFTGGPAGGQRLAAEQGADGSLTLLFTDQTNGDSTPAWRFVNVPAPAVDGSLLVDFNRTLVFPFAFSEHAVCPAPPRGNALDIPVTAGERGPAARA
ncbi:DUF1684 domain-containing protein [Zhihengliuella halotolerans]|uniref:DUF1684 domain-containing protein n=1 Tax=Zhihengliuella halotolerans TaxID=370736 RepID=A0A4Q8A8X2_9MICC|nr:DUF1684 domain-containing protein [Zhihengliuella halotolerans]RZU60510.1 hypothetical protein EV380_0040 [Zhihengliuella halotolerans]